jgi:hypothetical protein
MLPPANGNYRMGVLLIRCPAKGRNFSTGIQIETVTIDTLPQVRNRSYCPYCEAEHVWWTSEAILVDVIPPSDGVENQE